MTSNNAPEKTETRYATPPIPGQRNLKNEMDHIWEAFTANWPSFERGAFWRATPALEVYEKDDTVHVRAELPGLTDKDVEVTVRDDVLTIEGEKKEEHETRDANYYRSERTYGKFRRSVVLPDGADTDNARAQFKAGVLEIEIPLKHAQATELKKTIAVKSG